MVSEHDIFGLCWWDYSALRLKITLCEIVTNMFIMDVPEFNSADNIVGDGRLLTFVTSGVLRKLNAALVAEVTSYDDEAK